MKSSDMEIFAARQALEKSNIDPRKVGLIISYSSAPDYLMVANAPLVHRALGVSASCMCVGIEAVCNSFLHQLEMAWHMLQSGKIEYAILTQSNSIARCIPPEEPFSAWFGDGATAVIVGPVHGTNGIVGSAHYTDGHQHAGAVLGVPGKRWFDDAPRCYIEDKVAAQRIFLDIPLVADSVLTSALAEAKLSKAEVDFFACHQGTAWLRPVVQEYVGLGHARARDTFAQVGSLGAANLPYMLSLAEKDGEVRMGQTVALFSGGSGVTGAGIVLKWGI